MATVKWDKGYPVAEAERGKFVPIDTSTINDYPSGGRGKYAQLSYIVGGNIEVDGIELGDVDIDVEDFTPTNTVYANVTVPANDSIKVEFSSTARTVELFNNNDSTTVFVHFNSSTLATITSEGLPLQPEAFYSVDRHTNTFYIGNPDTNESVDVRVIGHYKA